MRRQRQKTMNSSLIPFCLFILFAIHTMVVSFGFLLNYYEAAGRGQEGWPARGDVLWAWITEWWCSLAVFLAYPFGLLPQLTCRPVGDGGPPILLVPGSAMNRTSLFALYWRLRRWGYHTVYIEEMRPLLAPLETLGLGMQERIRSISETHGGTAVIGIGHSQGGMLLRWCADVDPDLPLGQIITLGSAHHGSRIAVFGPGASARQMLPDSDFINALAAPPQRTLTSIYSQVDNFVVPPASAKLGDRQRRFDDLGHFGLLFSPRVFDVVLSELP